MPRAKTTLKEKRILVPGWAGEPEPEELEFLQQKLARDRRLAIKWGFDPAAPARPEWAIRQVAMWGDPNHRSLNAALAQRKIDSGVQLPMLLVGSN